MALLRPCSTSAGFLATPERPLKLDMKRLRSGVAALGYTVVIDAGIILIVRSPATGERPAVESSLYDTGKVLLKTTDPDLAKASYAELEPPIAASVLAARPSPR